MSIATAEQIKTQHLPALRHNADAIEKLENIGREYGIANTSTLGRFQAAFAMAAGIGKLREAITPEMMKDIMALQGTSLGFKTDKDRDGGYPVNVVMECFIEATLRGARPIGNEFNIIAGRCYLTKEFYMRNLGELEGVSNVTVATGIPSQIGEGLAGVRVVLKWKRYGESEQLQGMDDKPGRGFTCKYYKQLEVDQVVGKALRKAYKAAYEQVTGSQLIDGEDVDLIEGTIVTPSQPVEQPPTGSRTDGLKAKLGTPEPTQQPADETNHDDAPRPRDVSTWPLFKGAMEAHAKAINADIEKFDKLMGWIALSSADVKKDNKPGQAARESFYRDFLAGKAINGVTFGGSNV